MNGTRRSPRRRLERGAAVIEVVILAPALGLILALVIAGGRVVEEGRHDDLVARGGLYARLARLQFETGAAALAADGKRTSDQA
mgnify:CR=1 FL=1